MDAGAFSLLMDTRAAVAELMAEYPKCGAVTTIPLDAAWLVGSVARSECETAMPLDMLGRQVVGAQSIIGRLLAKAKTR